MSGEQIDLLHLAEVLSHRSELSDNIPPENDHMNVNLGKPMELVFQPSAPKGIKSTQDDAVLLAQLEGGQDNSSWEFSKKPAKSPYKSHPGTVSEATIVLASGIPAGAGLSLWRGGGAPKRRTQDGRWVPGSKAKCRPFVSAT